MSVDEADAGTCSTLEPLHRTICQASAFPDMRDPRAALFLVATALIGALPSCGGGRLGSSAGGAGGGGSLAAGSGGAGGGGSVASGMGGGGVAGRIGGAGGPPVTGAGGDCEMSLGGVAAAGADANGGNDRTNGGNGAIRARAKPSTRARVAPSAVAARGPRTRPIPLATRTSEARSTSAGCCLARTDYRSASR